MDSPKQPPATVRELGIELQGFQKLVDIKFSTLTDKITDLTKALEDSNQNKADQKDLDAILVRIVALELTASKKPWSAIFLSGTLMTVLTTAIMYVVNDLINGGK